jgi:hypothetical protein
LPDLCRWWLGGLMHHARACALLFAPYVNSYKRFRAGSFAPTAIAWALDNRTAGFRIVGSGRRCASSAASRRRRESVPGFRCHARRGARRHRPSASSRRRDSAAMRTRPAIAAGAVDAAEAMAEFEASALFKEAFGADVVEHLVHFARTEQRKFDETVTTWSGGGTWSGRETENHHEGHRDHRGPVTSVSSVVIRMTPVVGTPRMLARASRPRSPSRPGTSTPCAVPVRCRSAPTR